MITGLVFLLPKKEGIPITHFSIKVKLYELSPLMKQSLIKQNAYLILNNRKNNKPHTSLHSDAKSDK